MKSKSKLEILHNNIDRNPIQWIKKGSPIGRDLKNLKCHTVAFNVNIKQWNKLSSIIEKSGLSLADAMRSLVDEIPSKPAVVARKLKKRHLSNWSK